MSIVTQLKGTGLFDARVPRYTSYPTAPQFSDRVGPDLVADWVGTIPAGSEISLYVHIPFCRRLCWFCACRTQGTRTDLPVRAYIGSLRAELALLRERLAPGVRLSHLHWGGGTPTLLAPDLITELAEAIFDVVPTADGAQFSVEIDPTEVDEPRMDALAAAGMNRASIGVQDFDPRIQAAIGREQSFDATRAAAEGLRARGVASLNADMVYGLPYQDPEGIARSVQMLLALDPDRVALFGYAHVPWMAKRQKLIPAEALPAPEERLALFETARELFVADGYAEIGIDHFARPHDGLAVAAREGRLRRNFQGYTEDGAEALVGLGASSISRFPQGYAQNDPGTAGYQRAVREGRFATARGHAFDAEDLLRGAVIERILCDFAVDLRAFGAEHLAEGLEGAFPGLVDLRDGQLAIRPEGRPVARMIARHFDGYAMNAAGHSHAV